MQRQKIRDVYEISPDYVDAAFFTVRENFEKGTLENFVYIIKVQRILL